jgi:SNF2 family DNA or RNA helicase
MSEVREEQKGSIQQRCEKAIELASGKTSVYWCHYNDEGDLLEQLDSESVQVKGGDSVDKKEDILINFAEGNINRLITKPKITSFGLNWQHCSHTVYFPTWSYEQYYQAVRRFWRFGQKNNVTVDLVLSDGQKRVLDTLEFKTQRAIEYNKEIQKNISDSKIELVKKEFNQNIVKPKFI